MQNDYLYDFVVNEVLLTAQCLSPLSQLGAIVWKTNKKEKKNILAVSLSEKLPPIPGEKYM